MSESPSWVARMGDSGWRCILLRGAGKFPYASNLEALRRLFVWIGTTLENLRKLWQHIGLCIACLRRFLPNSSTPPRRPPRP